MRRMYLDDGQQYKHCLLLLCYKSYPKNVLFIEFEPLCQKLLAFMSSLARVFSIHAHQI